MAQRLGALAAGFLGLFKVQGSRVKYWPECHKGTKVLLTPHSFL